MRNKEQVRNTIIETNKGITDTIMAIVELNEPDSNDLLLRTIAMLSHQLNVAAGVAVIGGIPNSTIEKAMKIGEGTAHTNLTNAKNAMEGQIAAHEQGKAQQ